MKLDDILNEKQILSVNKLRTEVPVYKNPSSDEINIIAKNGIAKAIISPNGAYVFDSDKLNFSDLKTIVGVRCTLFFKKNTIAIQITPYANKLNNAEMENIITNNPYINSLHVSEIIYPQDDNV